MKHIIGERWIGLESLQDQHPMSGCSPSVASSVQPADLCQDPLGSPLHINMMSAPYGTTIQFFLLQQPQ